MTEQQADESVGGDPGEGGSSDGNLEGEAVLAKSAASDVASLHRFVTKIDQGGTSAVSCWIWTGAVGSDGYGRLRRRGQVYSAHRYAYELFKGPIPEDLCVMRRCDNPLCVNPAQCLTRGVL